MTQGQTKTKPPFPVRAAGVAFWAPIIAIIMTFTVRSAMKDLPRSETVDLILDVINLGLIVIGFFCSIVALLGNRHRGIPGLLWRSLVGLLLCGGLLLANAYLLFFFHPFNSMYPKYYGTWVNATSTANASEVLELRPDLQFHCTRTGKSAFDMSGSWDFKIEHKSRKLALCLFPQRLPDGSENTQGKAIVLQLDRIEGDAMHVISDYGPVTYYRQTQTPIDGAGSLHQMPGTGGSTTPLSPLE